MEEYDDIMHESETTGTILIRLLLVASHPAVPDNDRILAKYSIELLQEYPNDTLMTDEIDHKMHESMKQYAKENNLKYP